MTITYPIEDVIRDLIESNQTFLSDDTILPLGIAVEHKDYGELKPEDVKIIMVYKKP